MQEQNALKQYEIEQCAISFRSHKSLPKVLLDFFESNEIDLDKDILVQNSRMLAQGTQDEYIGRWVTCNQRFIDYTILLDETESGIEEIDEWEDVTAQIKINANTKGIGSTYGQLCIHVLNKLNEIDTAI